MNKTSNNNKQEDAYIKLKSMLAMALHALGNEKCLLAFITAWCAVNGPANKAQEHLDRAYSALIEKERR